MALLAWHSPWGRRVSTPCKKEPDLEKRSERAIEAADVALKTARALPANVDRWRKLQKQIGADRGAVELFRCGPCRDTGKRPYKLTRFYKRGELRTGAMLRSLDN